MKRAAARRSNIVSALTARTQFGQIMRRATRNRERFVVDRRGEPQVIIMSVDDYVDTIAPPPEWLQGLWAASKRRGTDKLTSRQIDLVIGKARRELRAKPSR
jgi:prevent-host-death family protein